MAGQNQVAISTANVNALPVGISDFETLRVSRKIYIDKTEIINTIASNVGFYFLSRPRRFGKTLLISIIESLFMHGLRDFNGLAIEKLWDMSDPLNQDCTVCHLDFSSLCNCTDFKAFKEAFYEMVDKFMADNPVPETPSMKISSNALSRFETWMQIKKEQAPAKLVMLIDEYDAPLNHYLDRPEIFSQVQALLSDFYFKLKSKSGVLRFMLITGVCRYRHTSIFSGFNNLIDITTDSTYGTLVGYTENELRKYLSPYIQHAGEVLGLSFEQCISRLKDNYDGFCFDQLALTHVFAPWSVLKFLSGPHLGFKNYWYESGGTPSLIMKYVKVHALKTPSEYGRDHAISLSSLNAAVELKDLSEISLLTQTGYLSIKRVAENGDLIVNYPNRELAFSMARLYADTALNENMRSNFSSLFTNFDAKDFISKLNAFFGQLSYEKFSLQDETSVQSALYLSLMASGLDANVESRNAFGRSDLEVTTTRHHFVIELKFARGIDDGDTLLQAERQIRDRHYGEFTHKDLPHMNIALVFSQQKRCFTHCKCFQSERS